MTKHCRLFLLLMMMGVAVPPVVSAEPASKPAETHLWVCAGYFEKRLDREVASHGIEIYRERFMATRDGAIRRAVFVFPVAYRVLRDHLRSQTATRFGEAAFVEHPAFDLRDDVAAAPGAKAASSAGTYSPGEQIASLAEPGVRLDKRPAAVEITTKPYNGVPSKNGWSQLHLLVLDGAPILGSDSTLVVAWREDSAEEWGTGKSGSLFSFGKHRASASFVTATEFALMERLGKLYGTPFGLFPLSDSGPLQKDAAGWQNAREWLERYRAKPDDDLQAIHPGRC
jgi:hypothetical protein